MQCSVCKKNPAIIFVNKQDSEGNNKLEGFCYNCAKQKGINPLETLANQSMALEADNINLDDMASQFEDIFKDLTQTLSNKDVSLDGVSATAIPLCAIFGNSFRKCCRR